MDEGTCIACFDDEVGGLRCHERHFLCRACVGGLVNSLIGTAELRRRNGGLACIAMDGLHEGCLQQRPTTFERERVEPLLEAEVAQQYAEVLADRGCSAAGEGDERRLEHW